MSLPFDADYGKAIEYVRREEGELTDYLCGLLQQRRATEEELCYRQEGGLSASVNSLRDEREWILDRLREYLLLYITRKIVFRLLMAQLQDELDPKTAYQFVHRILRHPPEGDGVCEVIDDTIITLTRRFFYLNDMTPPFAMVTQECRRYMEEALEDAPALTQED
ncbi:hypothetical protein COU80_04140 [Candidatus Peregrinibacteria bacterium CG10_big_fil_rev_8_21_14_0_10_55_24]|nr:MAG: hypothetical protein COU80_04140 [Candidatus Peregrinibacteria bacterium CG10_big_fil_rev_8_21_14_0_10_55_24]